MHDLIKGLFIKELKNPFLSKLDDGACLNIGREKILFTTDSYVVNPIFFAGGDIGSLSIYGTVNDLSVCGARPLFISVGLIIEDGLEMKILERVTKSIKTATRLAKVNVVTGDMKVVEKGMCDKIFINTSGVGRRLENFNLSLDNVRTGDQIIISGSIGRHGVSILSSREGFEFDNKVKSDCAPLNGLLSRMGGLSGEIRFMRDPTRGGLATTLNEFVEGRRFGIVIDEGEIPVSGPVKSVCELLGFDPLYMANEGRVVIIVSKKASKKALSLLKNHPQGKGARIIGEIVNGYKGKVCLKTETGGLRLLKMLASEQLPRIC